MLAVLLLVAIAPFERALLLVPGGFTLTTVEAVMLIAVAAMAVRGVRGVRLADVPLAVPGAVFLVTLLVAALAAPFEQANALRFVARMAMAALLFVMTLRTIDTLDRARLVVRVMLGVATLVAAVAVLEAAQVPAVMSALTVFRPGYHVVAGQLRATSTLFYPTIASMYLEVAFALGLWLLLEPSSRRPRLERAVVFVALTVVGAGIAATFTRAGLLALAAALAVVAALRLRRLPSREAGLGVLTALAGVLLVVVFLSHSPELLATRMTVEGSQAWYGARYQVPAALELNTGAVHRVPATVSNTGRLTWDSTKEPMFALSYHWLRGDSDAVVQFEGQRTPFPIAVMPGQTVTVIADVIAPRQPGAYTLVWDVVHETRAWLSTEGVPPARSQARVTGTPSGQVMTTMNRLPSTSARPARPALWSAAFGISRAHPWLGIGPDNYRHAYGPYLGIERWDRRVHANNMYLEVLTGAGIVGLIAFIWLLSASGLSVWRRLRHASPSAHTALAAALVAWLVIAGHGLVDSFLAFTTTYLTFALAAGLAFSRPLTEPRNADAHCI
jgi:hypothetical protein